MTDALNAKRRLERHRQQRRINIAADIRQNVERSQDNVKRLLFGGGSDDDDGGDSFSSGNAKAASPNDGDTTTTRPTTTADTSTTESTSSTSRTRTSSDVLTSSSTTQSSSTSSSSSSSSTQEPTTTSSSSTSTTEEPTSTRVRSTRSAETTSAPTSVVAVTNSNSIATSVQLITSSAAPIQSASATPTSDSNGVGAGPIIGIVAAALAGVVIVAAAIGFLVKKYSKKNDPYETNPFDADQFRRESVMLPEGFESDDGHAPSMTEHRNFGPASGGGAGSLNGYEDMGYAGAAAGMGGAYGSSYSHNDGGAPRPPTMFARHNDAHGPGVGAVFNKAPVPELPPMAFGGGDPYSLAGVAGGMHNVSNPYAHLDRHGDSYHRYQDPNAASAGLDRSGSDGSHYSSQNQYQQQQAHRQYPTPQSEAHETSGRPTSMEQGRSGTPDLPNVQQTYNLNSDEDQHHQHQDYMHSASNGRQSAGLNSLLDNYGQGASPASPRDQHAEYFPASSGASDAASGSAAPPASLQVRNLTGGHLMPAGGAQGQRPISTASSMKDDDAAYGGVY
ncbi:hypothetical protein BDZ90DRAFT_259064 [Jaminaea rosea]|uniref:Mid2 domain-containing protein n=1 Tax=Jaminaea rosea TaxID=1569628 RepID=A0A316UXI4_9BASI|nr:hypothetical protein BDZ90DRAFT_259064 [Jaminaea rosea]PWN29001.1 hypothetical protein BDZ90DRAFT_259064 [Jaminaea rosea]